MNDLSQNGFAVFSSSSVSKPASAVWEAVGISSCEIVRHQAPEHAMLLEMAGNHCCVPFTPSLPGMSSMKGRGWLEGKHQGIQKDLALILRPKWDVSAIFHLGPSQCLSIGSQPVGLDLLRGQAALHRGHPRSLENTEIYIAIHNRGKTTAMK